MTVRSDMCSKTVEEVAWEHVSIEDFERRVSHRKMMIGEFGSAAVKEAINAADATRELMGLKRRYLKASLRDKLKESIIAR